MNDTTIHIEALGKRYQLGGLQPFAALRRRMLPHERAADGGELWALRDLSLDIEAGEVVGIIGNNGAGKSTLLKILSRVTAPTEGRVEILGRVASLLEVGTGFHPELTGRENVYMNGTILGMRRREIDARFDEIVAFAQVERFLDTPVKRYSSGMRLRLAFAVAAHLEPEILLIDEVLAVGDAVFQRKCLGVMQEVARRGRTVIFVSHNMNAVANLCTRVIWLDAGRLARDGTPDEVIRAYLERIQSDVRALRQGGVGRYRLRDAPRNGNQARSRARVIESFSIRDAQNQLTDVLGCGDPVTFEVGYRHEEALARPSIGILISKPELGAITFLQTHLQHDPLDKLPAAGSARCQVESLALAPGSYTISIGISTAGEQLDWLEHQVHLEIQPADFFGTGQLPSPRHGPALVRADWSFS
jgi:homopolymeric O-antigen transport system ATP-binding protein